MRRKAINDQMDEYMDVVQNLEGMPVAEVKKVKFFSNKYPKLRVILKPTKQQIVDGTVIRHPGITVQFGDMGPCLFETDDLETIELLRKYAGPDYHEVVEVKK